jgi:anti-sigma regulatory factor (Ser/Thr protein kinase)
MIDLGCTRREMLAEIEASAAPEGLAEPSDPRFPGREDARLVVGSRPRRELFRLLEFALTARFAGAPRSERIRDLLVPLRCALGNAHKHGNRRDRSKRIEVEVVTSRRGAVLAIRDEGEGFDAASTVERMRGGRRYFEQQGSGLQAFENASSRIGWEAGGRTLLIRFLPCAEGEDGIGEAARIARALDAELASGCREPNASTLEICGVIVEAGDAPAPPRVRCMLREGRPGEAHPEVRILSGRLFADEASAREEQLAATQLHRQLVDSEIGVPRTLGPLRSEPRLALYDFDPWLDLAEYLAQRGASALPGAARRIASLLAALHRSGRETPEEALRAGFGPSCIHYGVDGRFSLDRFAGLGQPRPALDRGTPLARDAAPAPHAHGPIDANAPAVRISTC